MFFLRNRDFRVTDYDLIQELVKCLNELQFQPVNGKSMKTCQNG